ncbi:hypothetical protein K5P26_10970 [Sphingopyxis sp. XHP0097]|uniref:YHS domain-containing protein n=1 Tax=Sphingopyxis jiangsuensis TaxID=2871171 RepID=A0ABS7MF48_9SPHN|nr:MULTISPECIES: YHS domain-containing (seleno)protein [Sphingopyxis]MBL0769237.1 hypothetical protein [Sphingopyxis lutea]MBY4637657.1 hypothetical protein [Sphingopyxis jiangsuensis]
MTKTILAALIAAQALVAASPALAVEENNVSNGLTAAGAPLGLHGVDPVAFVTLGNRIEGSAKFTAVHDNVAYYFASQENLDAFKAAPGRFTPQNGGYCTFGVSVGKKFDGDPKYAAVQNGKLYVFLNEDILKAFQKDPAGTIAKADANWKRIRSTAAADL